MKSDATWQLRDGGREALHARWRALAGDSVEADAVFEELARLYASRGRAYHNLSHIDALLGMAEGCAGGESEALRYAIWFHDAIYRPRRGDNEAQSAELAATRLSGLGVSPDTIALVGRMILATQTHQEEGLPPAGRLFLDLDLSILGSDPASYLRYSRAIRAEYRWVPAILYRRERRKVLERFLRRTRIYLTEEMAAKYEMQARRNLECEIAMLA
ncbi:MAG: hypothetical protein SF339_28420 [Blastocatellia bacterium]|nr:hypothetical protein [Blastocatellia bacterium]